MRHAWQCRELTWIGRVLHLYRCGILTPNAEVCARRATHEIILTCVGDHDGTYLVCRGHWWLVRSHRIACTLCEPATVSWLVADAEL